MNKCPFLESENIPTLADELKEQCDLPLSIEECGVALSKLQNNKSPGSDGLTTNFYKFFWKDIKELLYQSYLYSYTNGSLSTYQKIGIFYRTSKTGDPSPC